MRPCVIGIGGAGGRILKLFLDSQDVLILGRSLGEHMAFGGIKGVWMDMDTSIPDEDKGFYTGQIAHGHYPGVVVPHAKINKGSKLYGYIREKYGYDLSRQGYDRRAEYLKAIFEIFQTDQVAKALSEEEYLTRDNPLLAYTWKEGIERFTSLEQLDKSPSSKEKEPGNGNETSEVLGFWGSILRLSSSTKTPRKQEESKGGKSLLFIASLGGGTGTGFINPLTNYIRAKGSFAAVALCVLTEKGTDSKGTLEGQRDLGAVIAMYDILTKKTGYGIDALILIDNQILQGLYEKGDYSAMNRAIFQTFKPFIDPHNFPDKKGQDESLRIQGVFTEKLKSPGVLIPCYSSGDALKSEKELVEKALSPCKINNGRLEGILFPCDFRKADQAYVFARGLLDRKILQDELQAKIGKNEKGEPKMIYVYPKIGEKDSREVLIFLRNPFGGETKILSNDNCGKGCGNEESWKKDTVSDSFEQRIYCTICMSLEYLRNNETDIMSGGGGMKITNVTKVSLGRYLYGEKWIDKNLKSLQDKTDLNTEEEEYKKLLEEAKGYLFNWNEIPGNDNKRLMEFLTREVRAEWVKDAKFEKINNDRTIKVSTENKSLSLKLDDKNTAVTLETDDDKTHKFVAKMEAGKLNVYTEKKPFLEEELEKSMERLQKGEKPFFGQELTIFGEDKSKAEKEGLMDLIEIGIKKMMEPIIEPKIKEIVDMKVKFEQQ
jgi:hypothetical protein